MKKIHRLQPDIIAKIAAGEVIERPAYVVKGLIENAIDAKATLIEIQVEESGLKRITVTDNGIGMGKDDLEICFLPHTTSKIKAEEDLQRITSFGFRGEALASIAAISHMTIITRTPKDIGGRIIQIRGGIVEDSAPIGSPIGTIVTAEGLFYNVPARKKFMKSSQTELRHITDIVSHYALMYPDIKILLKHNKKTVFDFPQKPTIADRVSTVIGSSLADELIPVSYEDGHISITGYIGKPQVALRQNQKQFLFVNGRHISDRMISLSVREAFGTLLPSSHTPVFILSLSLPHEMTDINIHPRKEQIAFRNQKEVFDTIKLCVIQALRDHNITFRMAKFKQENSARLGYTTSASGEFLRNTVLPWNRVNEIIPATKTPLSQILQTYIITTTESDIVFIDQHAAHERILYEAFLSEFKKNTTKKYLLEKPLSFELSASDTQVLIEHLEIYASMGFLIEHFQGNSFLLREVPLVVQGRNYPKIIQEIITDLRSEKTPESVDSGSKRMMAFLACRAAVKAGDLLTSDQMEDIISQINTIENSTTCPHGRPTTLIVPIKDLERSFRR